MIIRVRFILILLVFLIANFFVWSWALQEYPEPEIIPEDSDSILVSQHETPLAQSSPTLVGFFVCRRNHLLPRSFSSHYPIAFNLNRRYIPFTVYISVRELYLGGV